MDLENVRKDVEKIILHFNHTFNEQPELFLDEFEIRNTLFRYLLHGLVHNEKYPNLSIMREWKVNSKPLVKFDLAIVDKKEKIIFAFELKYTISNVKNLMKAITKDIHRLSNYCGEACQRAYLLFYNNFELYPEHILTSISNVKCSPPIKVCVITPPTDKIKMIQQKYLIEYKPNFPVH